MKTWTERVPALRTERHFGRPMHCYAERPRGLLQMLEEAAVRNPSGEALVCGEARLTWRALEQRIADAAAALASAGVRRGERIALLLGNRLEFPLAFLAAARLGAIAVPISVREQAPGLEYILRQSGACALVHDADLADRLPSQAAAPELRLRLSAEDFAALRSP